MFFNFKSNGSFIYILYFPLFDQKPTVQEWGYLFQQIAPPTMKSIHTKSYATNLYKKKNASKYGEFPPDYTNI